MKSFHWFFLLFLGFIPGPIWALSPIVQFQDLVAGAGGAGFDDGPFYSAQFSHPMGLCLNEKANVLYVADRDNNRIRAVNLDEKNRVETLGGTGVAGVLNGPLDKAQFNGPIGVVSLPNDLIAVNDAGNRSIRLIDIKKGMVSTLVGVGGTVSGSEVDAAPFQFPTAPWGMVFSSTENCLYFSHPSEGILRKLDLTTQRMSTVLQGDPRLLHPAVLASTDTKTYVSGFDPSGIFEIHPLAGKSVAPTPTTGSQGVSLVQVGEGQNVIALAANDKGLWAIEADPQSPLVRILPKPGPVTFSSVWGQRITIPKPGNLLLPFTNLQAQQIDGLIPDPRSGNRFYWSNSERGIITAFRDLGLGDFDSAPGESLWNSGGIHDFEYPAIKPKGTYRILIVGRSYTFWTVDDRKFEEPGLEGESQKFMRTLAKRLELSLNTLASLEDAPMHYEVLNGGMHYGISSEINVFSYYVAPPLAEHYDVDLVLLVQDEGFGLDSYFQAPLTKEGIPPDKLDPEYYLKKNEEKLKQNPLRDLFKSWQVKGYAGPESDTVWKLYAIDKLMSDPETRGPLIDLIGKPLGMLQDKLKAKKTSAGNPRRLALCYFPASPITSKSRRFFWRDLCDKKRIPFLDLCDDFTALGYTYYPYSQGEGGHFTNDGMFFFSTLLTHELLRNSTIPFGDRPPNK
jgi:hypothetical protein